MPTGRSSPARPAALSSRINHFYPGKRSRRADQAELRVVSSGLIRRVSCFCLHKRVQM